MGPAEECPMLPPEVQSLLDAARSAFREWVTEDLDRSNLGDLLAAEELAGEAGRAMSLGLVEDYLAVRLQHALAHRERCGCGTLKAVLQHTRWSRKTPFGVVEVHELSR
jgi:hypothetical protein